MQKKRRSEKPLALSLFSGAGGMDIGVLQAGFDILACVEWDKNCCETLRCAVKRERRSTKVKEGDVRLIDPVQLMVELGLREGELDLLVGGPPCQAFSQIGKQLALADERGMLLFEMTRFAKVFQPKAILIEQVKGLLTAKDKEGTVGGVFSLLMSELKSLGYDPIAKVICAADYGVAQLRKRVFVVSMKKPSGFQFPMPTHAPKEKEVEPSLLPSVPSYLTTGEALQGLGAPSLKDDGESRNDSHIDVTPAGDRFRIHGVPEGGHLAAQTHLPKEQIRNLTRKDTTKFLRVHRDRQSNTLRCGEIFFHPTEDRYLTPREYMRLHGYPDRYLLKGPIRGRSGRVERLDQHRQVANSVPPPVARALAEQILGVLRCQKSTRCLVSP